MTVDMPQRTERTPSARSVPNEELIIKEARRRHRQRMLAIAGIVVLVMAGLAIAASAMVGQSSSNGQPSPVSTRPSRLPVTMPIKCRNGQLEVSSSGSRGLGMNHWIDTLVFMNVSNTACNVSGYPVVVALDAQGHKVATAEPGPDSLSGPPPGITAPPTVTVKPGRSVSATVQGTSVPIGTATSCLYFPSFLVTPPGQTQAVLVTLTNRTLDYAFPGCSPIVVSPILDGSYGILPPDMRGAVTPVPPLTGKASSTVPSFGISATTTTP